MGRLSGLRIARQAPVISHLFFADDSLLFFKANSVEAETIKRVLTLYEHNSGQTVNYNKSSITFSSNTSRASRDAVISLLTVGEADDFGKYLGLPSVVGRNKKQVFNYVLDKIGHRVGSWSKRFVSKAGREILLKTVAQALPTYTMSIFLLPLSFCEDIERAFNRY